MIQERVFTDHEAASRHVADHVTRRLLERPTLLICLASGNTPRRAYELLAERGRREPSLFAKCRIIKLDEWGGLPKDDPATCEHHLRTALIEPLNLNDRYIAFDSQPSNPEAECRRIATWLAENGPIDTCVLGLGMNGHLGFNEPAEFLQPHAHVAILSETSLAHSMLANSHARPTYGLTLGLADILYSEHIMLIATGAAKHAAVARTLCGQITPHFPASFLQLHPDVELVCDATAGSTGP